MEKVSFYLKKYWPAYLIAVLFLIGQIVIDMLSPQITIRIIDDVIGNKEFGLLKYSLLMMFLFGIGRAVVGYTKEYLFDITSFKIGVTIRKNLFAHIQKLSVNFFDNNNTGEIMARVKDDVDRIQAAFGYIGMLSIMVVVHMTMVVICMIRISLKLSIVPLIAIPICAFLALRMEKQMGQIYGDISEENAQMNTVAEENLAGVRTVKAFAREKFEISKFLSHNKTFYDLNMRQSRLWIHYNPIFQVITKVLPLSAVLFGGLLVIEGELTLGSLGAFIEYCNNVVWPLEMLGWLSNELAGAAASKKKIDKIYYQVPQITEKSEPVELPMVKGQVEFDHVSLKIDDKEVLKDISFILPAGKTLGIMGTTGAGKSSVINLLLRFYDATEGEIRLDGVPIRDMGLGQLRESVALVMQDVFLFSDTVRENVCLGKKDELSDEDVNKALEKARAAEFVNRFLEKEQTVIGERGVGLSGGQKQRISMARAFAKKTPILILDDSTSALDMETEHRVQKNLEEISDSTKIIIAHRISAVRHADEILILEDGKIIERGTHETLMKQDGYYHKTYQAQYGVQSGLEV